MSEQAVLFQIDHPRRCQRKVNGKDDSTVTFTPSDRSTDYDALEVTRSDSLSIPPKQIGGVTISIAEIDLRKRVVIFPRIQTRLVALSVCYTMVELGHHICR